MSNYFPKYSPDGKWIVFCKAENYCLLRPDSELYIIPAAGGEARRLECNTSKMNSWHSWSPNSRWLVFVSKLRGPYTQLYLTHIDEQGHSSPPVFLEKFVIGKRAANIPEFVPIKPESIRKIYNYYISDSSFLRIKTVPIDNKKPPDIEASLRKRIAGKPADPGLYNDLGIILEMQGKLREALACFSKAFQLNPESPDILNNLGMAYKKNGDIDQAVIHYQKAIKLDSKAGPLWFNLGVALTVKGNLDKAEEAYNKALAIDKTIPEYYLNLGSLLKLKGRDKEAFDVFMKGHSLQK